MDINELSVLLENCYSKDTCYSKVRDKWSRDNKTLGHCAIVALIVNDYFGGDIYKCYVNNLSHYYNVIDGKLYDLTEKQFGENVNYIDAKKIERDYLLNDNETNYRYKLLKMRLDLLLKGELDESIND